MGAYPTYFGKEALLQCSRGELFGPGNAQLPAPPMLMMDRITEISGDGGEFGKGHVVAEFDIAPVRFCHDNMLLISCYMQPRAGRVFERMLQEGVALQASPNAARLARWFRWTLGLSPGV